jgi:hypothetical protein
MQLNAGIQSSIDQLHYDSYIWKTRLKANGFGASWKIGTRLTLFNQYRLGVYYDTGINIKTKAKESSGILFGGSDPDSLENILFKEEWDVRADLPARMHLGIYSRFWSFGLSAEYAKIFWDGLQENWSNSNLFAGNINYFYKDYLYTSLGILSVTSHLRGTALFSEDFESNLRSIYLFTGFGVNVGNRYLIDFAFADGESYSGKWRKGNIVKISVSIGS